MGFVYLIGMKNQPNKFKIGSTRRKDINDRLKQLQTGNAEELYIKDFFETEKPFKLEQMLHNKYKSERLIGEWFEMSSAMTDTFHAVCENYQSIINSLKQNPFF